MIIALIIAAPLAVLSLALGLAVLVAVALNDRAEAEGSIR